MFIRLLIVGAGGFLGAVSRYSMSGLINKMISKPMLPWGTLIVNIAGCLLIGFLSGLFKNQIMTRETRLLLIIGFLGSFTTFSTFGNDLYQSASSGHMLHFLLNLAIHIIAGLAAVWAGYRCAGWL